MGKSEGRKLKDPTRQSFKTKWLDWKCL